MVKHLILLFGIALSASLVASLPASSSERSNDLQYNGGKNNLSCNSGETYNRTAGETPLRKVCPDFSIVTVQVSASPVTVTCTTTQTVHNTVTLNAQNIIAKNVSSDITATVTETVHKTVTETVDIGNTDTVTSATIVTVTETVHDIVTENAQNASTKTVDTVTTAVTTEMLHSVITKTVSETVTEALHNVVTETVQFIACPATVITAIVDKITVSPAYGTGANTDDAGDYTNYSIATYSIADTIVTPTAVSHAYDMNTGKNIIASMTTEGLFTETLGTTGTSTAESHEAPTSTAIPELPSPTETSVVDTLLTATTASESITQKAHSMTSLFGARAPPTPTMENCFPADIMAELNNVEAAISAEDDMTFPTETTAKNSAGTAPTVTNPEKSPGTVTYITAWGAVITDMPAIFVKDSA